MTGYLPLQFKMTESGLVSGLAAAFGNVDLGGDMIMPGAFATTLAEHKAAGTAPAMLLYHDNKRPVGRWTEIEETSEGLFVTGKMTLDCSDGREAYALARDGAITGLSVGYLPDAKPTYRGDVRELASLKLVEVSLTPTPMNPLTRLTAVKAIGDVRDIEGLLREGGLSSRRARAAANAAWKSINDNDGEADERIAAILSGAITRLSQI